MAKKKTRFTPEDVMPRFLLILVIFGFLGVLVIFRATKLMTGEAQSYWLEVKSRYKSEGDTIQPKRGNILAADGQVLATSLPEYRLYMDFIIQEKTEDLTLKYQKERDRLLYLKIDSLSQGLHELFPEVSAEDFKEKILKGRMCHSRFWSIYSKRIDYVTYCKVKQLPYFKEGNIAGLNAVEYQKRKKPFGRMAYATIGIYDPERDSLKTALEEHFNKELTGTPGIAHREKVLNQFITFTDSAAVDGCDVVTTLDVATQDLVEKTLYEHLSKLEARIGMCVVMDVKTGDVKAISSLQRMADGTYLEGDNRALSSRREPGSVFKNVAFMAAFEDGKIDLNDGVDVGGGVRVMYGRRMKDSNWYKGGWGRWLSAVEIIKLSSNVGTSVLIDNAYHNHPEAFVNGVYRTGIATKFDIPIAAYKPPVIRKPKKDKTGRHYTNWYHTALPWMSIGYETQIPPIQTLAFYNGIANGGVMVEPRFVTAIKRGDEVVKEFPVKYVHADRPDKMMCSKQTLEKVKKCVEAVVTLDGTGKDAYSKRFRSAGKTGTAQIWERGRFTGASIISFVGYFPVENPQYSIIVCMEKGMPAYGGSMCGPIYKQIAETLWARTMRADLKTACDTSRLRHMPPTTRRGNLLALSNVLDEMNISYERCYENKQNLAWGGDIPEQETTTLRLVCDAQEQQQMPNVLGYGLRDAVYRLERMGLKVKAKGYGSVVEQSIPAGTAIKRGQKVELTLTPDNKKPPKPKPKPKPEPETTPAATAAENSTAAKPEPTTTAKPATAEKPATTAKPAKTQKQNHKP